MTQTELIFTPTEIKRMTLQCRRIVKALLEGPTNNTVLAVIALKYTSRISDIRKAGIRIEVTHHDHKTGAVTYQIVPQDRYKAEKFLLGDE